MAAESGPLPVPDYFRFEWDTPGEAGRSWAIDLMHWPHGLSTLSATMDLPPFLRGTNKAARELRLPLSSIDNKIIRGYVYNSIVPYSTDPAEVESRTGQMTAQMMKHIPGLLERWRNEYEPEVRSINEETLKGDYGKLSDGDLADFLRTLMDKREREGEIHSLAVFPVMAAVMFYEQVYSELLGEPKSGEHLLLLQGFPNKSAEANTALWHLAMEARRRPQLLDVLERAEPSAVHAALPEVAGGGAFRGAVEEFLSTYGWRSNELDIASPTWVEDPTTVYKLIREYATPDSYNPEDEFKAVVAARQAREMLAMDRLSGPDSPVDMFRQVLAGAQQYTPIQEDHNFWIDQQGIAVERVPVLEAARRLVEARRIADPADVFFLAFDELQDALRGGPGDLSGLVARRRREQQENRGLKPPPVVGMPPPPERDEQRVASQFFGGKPRENPDPRLIEGNGASPGRTTGTARIILSLEEADRLSPGEILVCPATMPPWTPLFGIASAVVTDHGGVLSHTAIVAREYQIPAVVGTAVGTALIEDGRTITVDGDAGTVKLDD